MLKSGFSCKGNSRLNVRFSEYRSSMMEKDFGNTSVSTFYGTLGVIATTKPKICILENVDSIGTLHQDPDSAEPSNLRKVVDELHAVDGGMYAVKVFELRTDQYLLPQQRTVWVVNN